MCVCVLTLVLWLGFWAFGCVCWYRHAMFVCPSDRHFSIRLFLQLRRWKQSQAAIYGIPAIIIIAIAIVIVAGTRVVSSPKTNPRPLPGRTQTSQPRHVHDTLAPQSVLVRTRCVRCVWCAYLGVCICGLPPIRPNYAITQPSNHPAQTCGFRPQKRIETHFVCSGWSAEEHWGHSGCMLLPSLQDLPATMSRSRFTWFLSFLATFAPLALNHVLIPEPLVHQINTKHRSENVINNAHRRLRLEVAQGVCSTAILPQPLRPPSSGHVTKLIWRSGHKQLVSKTKQLQWSKGCEGI